MLRNKIFGSILLALCLCIPLCTCACGFGIKASAEEYMRLDVDTRIELAESKYSEFAKNPYRKYEVMISFRDIPYMEIPVLLAEQNSIISAFHYYEYEGERVYGGYTDCEGKSVERVISHYYDSVYAMISGNIENYNPPKGIEGAELDEFLQSSEDNLRMLISQREAMDRGEFLVYGMRIVMSGRDIADILDSEYVLAVEILNFDNNNVIVPILE